MSCLLIAFGFFYSEVFFHITPQSHEGFSSYSRKRLWYDKDGQPHHNQVVDIGNVTLIFENGNRLCIDEGKMYFRYVSTPYLSSNKTN